MPKFSPQDRFGWPKRLEKVNIRNFYRNGINSIAKEFCGYSIVTKKHTIEELQEITNLAKWRLEEYRDKVLTGSKFTDKKGRPPKVSKDTLKEIKGQIEFADLKGDSITKTEFKNLIQETAKKHSNSTVCDNTILTYKNQMDVTYRKAQRKSEYRLEAESDLRNVVSAAVAFQASVEGLDACQILNIDATQFLIARKDNVIDCVVPLEL